MKPFLLIVAALVIAAPLSALADDLKPQLLRKDDSLLELDHSDVAAAKKLWRPYRGVWTIGDGVMRARSEPGEGIGNARIVMPGRDMIFQFRVRLIGDVKAFHFGFDPDTYELDKSGSLFSLILTDNEAALVRHADRRPEKNDPEKTLDSKSLRIKDGDWYLIMLEREDEKVVAQIQEEGASKIVVLEAEHESFKTNSPMMVFRCLGKGVEIDDVMVWNGR